MLGCAGGIGGIEEIDGPGCCCSAGADGAGAEAGETGAFKAANSYKQSCLSIS
jgi:hypothetical protein